MILDSPGGHIPTQGLPNSSISESMISGQTVCLGKITLVPAIKFII